MLENKTRELGAASIIVVIFMSIILTIVTIGFIRIALNEQRNSTDDDLATKAYYAAESGVEDAKRAIGENLNGDLPTASLKADSCDSPSGYNNILSSPTDFDIAYTCMLIDYTPSSVQAQLGSANLTKQYEVNPVNPITAGATDIKTFTLEWHIDGDQVNGGDGAIPSLVSLRGATDITVPDTGAWSFPALMKIDFIVHPASSAFGRANIKNVTYLISPNLNGSGNHTLSFSDAGQVLAARCVETNNDQMACTMDFDVGASMVGNALDVRITNLYMPTTVGLSMVNSIGQNLLFNGAQAVIDVTGKAGEVFRRVQANLDLSSPDLITDYAVQSATDICKDFSFTTNQNDFSGQDRTSCTR